MATTDNPYVRRRCSIEGPPSMSELRIILLGKSYSETSSVGNFILGRSAFETKAPPLSVVQHSEQASGWTNERYITVINATHLYNSEHTELTEGLKECVSLTASGPHVFLLLVTPQSFTDEDTKQLKSTLNCFSEWALNYSILISTDREAEEDKSASFNKFLDECDGRFHVYKRLDSSEKSSVCQLFEDMDKVMKVKKSLACEISEGSEHHDTPELDDERGHAECPEEKSKKAFKTGSHKHKREVEKASSPSVMNLVLCGRDESLKAAVSELILPQRLQRSHSTPGCMTRKGTVCGHQLTLVEIPALYNTQLSEEQICETLHSVLRCDPGVHAFFIIVPEGNFSDEDKAEIETIQRHFSWRIHNHMIFLINQQSQMRTVHETAISSCGGLYEFITEKTDSAELIRCVDKLITENKHRPYTMTMYIEVQFETQLEYRREMESLQHQIDELKRNRNKTQDTDIDKTLRIVLLGKTGVGKSATGNTILGKEILTEDFSDVSVTTVCQKEMCEINGRQITVVDTPGLFDTKASNIEIKKEIVKCISMSAPGPHVFLLVLKLGQRFTQEERDAVNMIKETFGETYQLYTVVLFTCGDLLKKQTIEQYTKKAGSELKKILFEFGNRYHVFNNIDKTSNIQVCTLLDKIDFLVRSNKVSCYTNEMFQQVEKAIKENQERILKDKEKQIEREKEELRAKFTAEMEIMKTEMQEQKEQQEAEARRKELEFKEREEQIKNDLAERERTMKEDFRKIQEQDDLKVRTLTEQINREREESRKQWEKQREEDQKLRDLKEEEERKKREQIWFEKKKEEKDKFEKEKEELKRNEEEALNKLQQEYEQRAAEEERRRKDLEEQIKHAEESKKKELLELQSSQLQESERRLEEEERRRDEQQKEWEMKIQKKEDQWNLEQREKQEQYEQGRQREQEERELKENERKVKEEEEKKRIETEANEKIEKMKEQLEAERLNAEQAIKDKDEQHRQDMEKRLQDQKEAFRREKDKEERIRTEAEKKNLAFINEQHSKELENLKKQTEQEARNQAEEEFNAKLDKMVQEAKTSGFEEGLEQGRARVESERSKPGKGVDSFLSWVCKSNKKKVVKESN